MNTDTPLLVISFGYGHGPAPAAHAVFDVRHHFRDPDIDPALRHLTARDPAVVAAVRATPGVAELTAAITAAARAFTAGPQPGPVTIAVGCAGGRHRSAVIAADAAAQLTDAGAEVALAHRDLHRPVITRPAVPPPSPEDRLMLRCRHQRNTDLAPRPYCTNAAGVHGDHRGFADFPCEVIRLLDALEATEAGTADSEMADTAQRAYRLLDGNRDDLVSALARAQDIYPPALAVVNCPNCRIGSQPVCWSLEIACDQLHAGLLCGEHAADTGLAGRYAELEHILRTMP